MMDPPHMRPEPEQSINPRAVSLWRVQAMLRTLIYGAVMAATFASIMLTTAVPPGSGLLLLAALLIQATFGIGVIPRLRYKYWRYHVDENELDIQSGVFVITRTLVPLVRVQNVDTVQGPLGKYFGLSSVTVSTAASTHEIPALSDEQADALRDRISRLAQVARESL